MPKMLVFWMESGPMGQGGVDISAAPTSLKITASEIPRRRYCLYQIINYCTNQIHINGALVDLWGRHKVFLHFWMRIDSMPTVFLVVRISTLSEYKRPCKISKLLHRIKRWSCGDWDKTGIKIKKNFWWNWEDSVRGGRQKRNAAPKCFHWTDND